MIFITPGGIALVLLVAAGILIGYAIYAGGKLDASSKGYVGRVVPEIVGAWSAETLKRETCAELSQQAAGDQVDAAFRKVAALGNMLAYRGSKGESKISNAPMTGNIAAAKYETSVRFEHGDATIEVCPVRRDDRWQVRGLFVKSDQLVR
jgi:hypothetical protein